MTEEVSIWGWPLQTAGMLTTEYSSRSFSVISGRVTEWSTWETKYSVREANSSWIQGRWSSSVVQFDPNTWILEYKKSFLSDNSRMVFALVEFLKFRVIIEFEKMKQQFWLPFVFGRRRRSSSDFTEGRILIPT
ncbi:hypothetical protein CDL12_23624 [Handroanthus impetiginosus]|uniref:Uncharacterized protein n=1 Tax=Handroanthus impetiginosus TaxID=429701 RepID=A0A2G9GF83_9LAMI|nr:hypothetical protein CDL12_23624 [Handroanthus impetiginosus]